MSEHRSPWRDMTPEEWDACAKTHAAGSTHYHPLRPAPTRTQVEQAFIDGSVGGSPIDHDGNRLADEGYAIPTAAAERQRIRAEIVEARQSIADTEHNDDYKAGWLDALETVAEELDREGPA